MGPSEFRRRVVFLLAVVPACSCGYYLVDNSRTIHVALSAEGAVHPEALPAVSEALSSGLRDQGLRLSSGEADAELAVVVTGSAEHAALPAEDAAGNFQPSAWETALEARATLRRADGAETDLGTFEASGLEALGHDAAADDAAQASAYALAARLLAERIVAAVLAAW
ncbi:MAG: hypothetical protein HY905_26805 [Deltaproteobacteria bacterium]|nr:hypothetical protein [Deltaproteobacteria bacterium]